MMKVTIYDNGAAFLIRVNGLTVKACNSLGDAWRHIEWMYRIESQQFVVGKNEVPVKEWLDHMYAIGYLERVGVEI